MKNIFRFLMAVAVLFTASCAKEDISSSIGGGEVEVTFTANLPELGTRAEYGTGTQVNTLRYYVYDNNDTLLEGLSNTDDDDKDDVKIEVGKTTTVNLVLLKGMKYNILFWADNGSDLYTINDGVVSFSADGILANDESRDAFYAAVKGFDPATAEANDTIIDLYRPFAQLNAIVTNMAEVGKSFDLYASGAYIKSTIETTIYTSFDAFTGDVGGKTNAVIKFGETNVKDFAQGHLSMNYLLPPSELSEVTFYFEGAKFKTNTTINNIPLKANYKTNIIGKLLTASTDFKVEIKPGFDGEMGELDGQSYVNVKTANEFNEAFANNDCDIIVLDKDIVLDAVVTRASDPTYTVPNGKELTIDLNGKTLSATSTQTGKNYNMFDVRGTLTVKNGDLETKHEGENMGWGNSTNLFNVTAGGVLNLEGVTAKNLGGSDMAFVAHLNNWGEVTLNVENSTLESTYVPVRVFNSGNDMNNVTIKNSILKGVSAAFWVHNYTAVDFGSEEKAEAHKALLNLNIYNQGNTFSPDVNGIRYGFTNSIRSDAYGITKTVSEDGTEVTLGSIVEDGLVRRGVAGDEENTTIKKAIVGEGVTTLYDRTFRRFYALETVELPSTLTTIGAAGSGVFQSCTALKNIVLPESVTVLGKGTFQECSSLESINIPSGVTRIEENCLRATGLVEVEFHAGVTYFGAQAFRDCKQLKEVVINAPEFTMEGNTFGITAAPFTPMTIYVANAEMQAYVVSKLTAHAKTYITVVAPEAPSNATELDEALNNGKNVILTEDLTFSASDTTANSGYGATGVKVDGSVLDGNGKTLTVNNAWGTWDCAVNAVSGTIKNLTVSGAMRGIFMGSANGDVYIDNVIFDNVIYTFNSDGGNKNYGVYISNSTLNGWTSHSDVHKEVVYTNCSFGKGNGYAFCRPYGPTKFVSCEFAAGFTVDPIANISFENCTLDGVALTAENISTLVTDASKVTVK